MAQLIVNALVIAFLAAWFLATLLKATPISTRWLRSHFVNRFIPRWNFFAPRPGMQDFRLLYREVLIDNIVGPWHEIPMATHGPWAWIWNPDKRLKKCLIDLTVTLVAEMVADITMHQPNRVKLSIPYLLILYYVVSLSKSPFAAAMQFSVVRNSRANEEPVSVFVSGVHDLQ